MTVWESITQFYSNHAYVVKAVFLLLIAFIMHIILTVIHRSIHERLKKSNRIWDDALTYAIYIPLKLILWGFIVFICISIFHQKFHFFFYDFVVVLYQLLILGSFILFSVLFARKLEGNIILKRAKIDYMTLKAIAKIYYILLAVIAVLSALHVLGIPLSAVIAFGGVGGIAVGFAAKDFLANLFGGLMIFIGRPFVIGDWVRSPDRSIEGIVEEMGWRQVKIRTLEKRPLYVPNSLFSTIILENVSRMFCRKIEFDISIRYQDISKVNAITSQFEKYLLSREDIDTNLINYVKMTEFAESWITIKVSCFPKTKALLEYLAIRQELFIKAVEIVEQNGAEFAFNTVTVMQGDLYRS
ncbi:MAG: mechanosensitive ion channel family protein [Simkaniaceae bacterium]|nr:mechanosensitive ion channel family protein [Simkaniaceae bacterium]